MESSKDRFFALPCDYYNIIAEENLKSTDRKLLFAIIWFTLGWGTPTKTVPRKSLRKFAKISEKTFYESRKRLVASRLISIQEQRPTQRSDGTTRQSHTKYTVLLAPKPYHPLPYDLVEFFAPELSGPELLLWLVIMRRQKGRDFWFATLRQLQSLTGYGPTAIKKARNTLLQRGLIEGQRGLSEPLSVAGYRSSPPQKWMRPCDWKDLGSSYLWVYLEEQQVDHTGGAIPPNLRPNEAAFLNNVFEQLGDEFLAATDRLMSRLADQGRLHLYERELMALANELHRRFVLQER